MQKINLILQPSKWLATLLIILYAGSILCVAYLPMYWWVTLIVVVILLWRFCISWRKYILQRGPNAIVHIWVENNEWYLQNALGKIWQVNLCGNSWVTRYISILNFKPVDAKRNISVPLLFDSFDKEVWRELRKYLLITSVVK